MSKNFELLHGISNEKELFQTLDDWEGVSEAAEAGQGQEADGNESEKASWQTTLPDVFKTVRETLGTLDLSTPEFIPASKPEEEPVERKDHKQTLGRTLGDRFPISGNPLTRLNSALGTPSWAEPETAAELGGEVEVEWKPETLGSLSVPETLPATEWPSKERPGAGKPSSLNGAAVQEPRPVREERVPQEAPQSQKVFQKLPRPEPPAGTWIDESKSSGKSRSSKVRAHAIYKDPRREWMAREEELKLVQRIFLGRQLDSPRVALFSGLERDGACAAICARAAGILASQGEGTVCVVDADFRVPSLHEYFAVQNEKGLAEAVLESGHISEFAQQLSPANLWLIPSGYGASQCDLAKSTDRLRARMEELRQAYRYVVVHSGPLWPNMNALSLCKWTDGVVLVLEANATRRDTARRIKESLAVANAKVLGVVLNNRSYPIPESLYSRL
jgi:Mrp family chromosome partitioning ATPase